jgi:diguanylate cyclase
MPRTLDFVVSSVAAKLMDANASTATKVSQQVLAHLVEQFAVDAAFLRYNNCNMRASKLVAEWPPRCNRPDPDPLEIVDFASADPVFAYCADGKEPIVIELDPANSAQGAYHGRVAEHRRVGSPSVAAAPLVSSG